MGSSCDIFAPAQLQKHPDVRQLLAEWVARNEANIEAPREKFLIADQGASQQVCHPDTSDLQLHSELVATLLAA